MPLPVPKVRWRCPQCRRTRWYKPVDVKNRRYCSRPCQYAAARVPEPVRAKQSVQPSYGERTCRACGWAFVARRPAQGYCSQACSLSVLHERRRHGDLAPRPCEHCRTEFKPRVRSARFCSRPCLYAGSRAEKSANWRGGRHVDSNGYAWVIAKDHPAASGHGGYVRENRLVMERMLGRHLQPHETVHHINGDRADNRPENLQLRSGRHGKGVFHRCADCGSTNIVTEPLA